MPSTAREPIHRLILPFSLLLLLLPSPVFSETQDINPEKLEAIKELMSITDATTNSEQFSQAFSQQLLSVLRISNPDISEQMIDIVHEEVRATVAKEFRDETLQKQIYPIYAEYFTLEELKGLVAFNKSAVGTKANRMMPHLMQDTLAAAQSWSQMVGPKISANVLERFEKEGIPIRIQPAQ